MNPVRKRVLVAMSGGVDSSVAAALLKKQGYFVMGGFMKNFSPESWQGTLSADCPWEQDFADVQAVCEKLGIECRSFNFEKEYRDRVIEYFFDEYAAGRTPNPDVMCNKEIKFGLFLKKALELGFDYIATGHYARVSPVILSEAKDLSDSSTSPSQNDNSMYTLLKGLDPKKDQSYFLYTLNQKQLARTLFPIGKYRKTQVRAMAKKFGLPNAEKKDSQGICFVGHVNLREFLKQRLPERVGEIVNADGEVIGTHQGAWYYTIGQRQGLGIGGGSPHYVAQKDVVKNIITVAPPTYTSKAKLKSIHWIGNPPLLLKRGEGEFQCKAKIRYQQEDQLCTVLPGGSVEFKNPQFAIAPGQSIVFYRGDQVLGGGVIK